MKPEELDAIAQFTYCIKCGSMHVVVPHGRDRRTLPRSAGAHSDVPLPDGPEGRGGGREARPCRTTQHGVWRCHFAGSCSEVCPKGVDPSLGIQLLKRHVMWEQGRPERTAFGEESKEPLKRRGTDICHCNPRRADDPDVLYERRGAVAILTLNREEQAQRSEEEDDQGVHRAC